MAEYKLPDGKILNVDDNATQEDLVQLQGRLAELYPEHYSPYKEEIEQTFGGHTLEILRGLPAGIVDTTLSSAQGISEYFDDGNDNKLTEGIRGIRKYYSESDVYKPAEGYEDAYSTMFGKGLGSMTSLIGAGMVNPATFFTALGGLGVDAQADNVKITRESGKEVSPFQEFASETLGIGVGFTEGLNPVRFLRFLKKDNPATPGIKNKLMSAFKTGGLEAAQEVGAGIAQNIISQGVYDADIPLTESSFDDATVGFGVGAAADLIFKSFGGRRNVGNVYNQEQAEQQDKQLQQQDEIIKERVILASQQGDQVIDPELITNETPFGINQEEIVEGEITEPPVLETYKFVPNEDGSVNILGNTTGESIGVLPDIEQAGKFATETTKQKRNEFIVSSALQASSINGLLGNGTATRIGQKIYDPMSNFLDAKAMANFDSKISEKRQRLAKVEEEIAQNEAEGVNKLVNSLMENTDTTGLSIEELGELKLDLETKLSNIPGAYPIKGNKVDPSSTLGLFWKSAEKKGIGKKSFYTINEAKKLLNANDFNAFMSEKAAIQFKKVEATDQLEAVARIKGKVDTSEAQINKTFKSKNIDVDYSSPAFEYLAEQFTGAKKINSMSKGQKEMLIAQVKSLPRFNVKTKLPNYAPRPYTANQLNNFYNQFEGQKFTNNDIKLGIKNNQTGGNLTPKQINQFKTDLLDSGRADKTKSRLTMTNNFRTQQALKAESFINETKNEFAERLQRTTTLLPEEINAVVEGDGIYEQGVINAEDVLKLPSPIAEEKYLQFLPALKERLNSYGLKDVGIRFDNALKASLNIRQKDGKTFYKPTDKSADALYDRPLKTIIASMERVDPTGTLTETELEAKLTNILDHETVHALVQMNLLKQSEFQLLIKEANKRIPKRQLDSIKNRYADLTELQINEELVAELFRLHRNNPQLLAPKPKTIIDKIIKFFTNTIQTIYDSAFTSPRTILKDIESGVIGSRERGEIRNYRNLEISEQNKNTETPSANVEELAKLRDRLYRLESIYNQDYARMSNANANKNQKERFLLERKIEELEKESPSFNKPTEFELAGLKKFRKGMMASIADGVQEMQKVRLQYIKDGVFGPFRVGRRFITKQFGADRIYEIKVQTITGSGKNTPYYPVIKVEMVGGKTDRTNEFSPEIGDKSTMVVRFMDERKANSLLDLIENDPNYIKFYDGPKEIEETPSYNRAGLLPKELLYAGQLEEQVYKTWRDNNKNPKAEDFKALHKILAPQSKRKHDFVDYSELKSDVKKAAEIGIDSKWYEKWGTNIPNIIGSANMREFSGIFGITSAQATPEKNLQDTFRTMIIARKYNPETQRKKFITELRRAGVGKSAKARAEAIANFYKLGIFAREGSSQKTLTYALEVLAASNGEFTPFMVVDRHMLRKFGLDASTTAATEIDYRMVQAINALLATENYTVNGQPVNFNPPQIQALLWGHQRYTGSTAAKITNEGSYDSALQYSQKEVAELKEMEEAGSFDLDNPFSGNFISPPRYTSNKKSDIFNTDLAKNMYESILNSAPQTIISFKFGKTRGYLPQQLQEAIPFERWMQYQNNVLKGITSGGKIKFLRTLGIPHDVSISAATWEGEVNPTVILKLPGADPQTQKAVAAVFTDAFMQDASIVAMPQEKGTSKTSLLITKIDNDKFSKAEIDNVQTRLSQLVRDNKPLDFMVSATNKTGIILTDPKQYSGDPYTVKDLNDFIQLVKPALLTSGLGLEKYGQKSELIRYGRDTSESAGTRGALRQLGNKVGFTNTSDLQRAAIRDLYIPTFEEYKNLANEIGFEIKSTPPYLEEDSALSGILDFNAEEIAKVEAIRNKDIEDTARGMIPKYGINASPIALKIAFDFENEIETLTPKETPSYSRKDAKVPDKYKDIVDDLGGANKPDKSFSDTLIDVTDFTEDAGSFLSRMRQAIVDNLAIVEKGTQKAASLNEEVRERQQSAETGALQALRFAGQSRGLFSKMLTVGIPVYQDGGTVVVPFKHGGLIQIFAPLWENSAIDLESIYKLYSIGQRSTRLNKEGKLVPLTKEQIKLVEDIEADYKVVVEVYNQYQEFNNALLDYAKASGILGGTTLVEDSTGSVEVGKQNGKKDGKKYILKDTVELWKENSDYYPFYRQMSDENIGGPKVASGFLGPNPLSFKLKGSEEAIEPAPLEVISRNMISIMYSSMKNQGLARLMEEYELAEMAVKILPTEAQGTNVIPVYINGQKQFYRVADPLLVFGLQSMGLNDVEGFTKILGVPSSILRETVTRDPGFILKNMLRDTLSAAVTSDANITPFVDTFKNFNADLTELENRGIIGGYDAANDRQGIVKQINKLLKEEGRQEDGGLSTIDGIVKIWDWLGSQTTKSDGATRKAVADKIYELTGSNVEASYQALEIINFNRRGGSPIVKLITTGIPFLNARIQGLDVLYRSHTGKYSASISKENLDKSAEEIAMAIRKRAMTRGLMLTFITGLYYLLVGDDEQYRGRRVEERDDNWLIFFGEGVEPLKIPVPFEVGFIYKTVPERAFDLAFGRSNINDTTKSLQRGVVNTLKVDPLGFQLVKPLTEVINNKSTYTGNAIIPYYMETGLDPQEQYTMNTTELARGIGKALNISPMKIDYLMKGYGGTLGTYLLTMGDLAVRQVTGRDYVTPRLSSMPFVRSLFASPYGGGFQQQFYELRAVSNRYQQTLNKLKTDGRMDEYNAYRQNNKGLAQTRKSVLQLEKYMKDYRNKKKRIELHPTMSGKQKRIALDQLERNRDMRLSVVPKMIERADIPSYGQNLFRN